MARTAMARRRRRERSRGTWLIACVVLLITLLVWVQSRDVEHRIASYQVQQQELNEQIAQEQARAEEIAEFEKYAQTKAYAEEQAHEKLGLVREGEILFKLE